MAVTKFQVKRELVLALGAIEQLELRIKETRTAVQNALDYLEELETEKPNNYE